MKKEQILKHIQSARIWLDKAQTFVEGNNIIRGLSFLFLASAETQMPLRESRKAEKTGEKEIKKVTFMKPAYGIALAAGLSFIVAIAGWEMLFKEKYSGLTAHRVTVERISASEFANKMRESNERQENKAFALLDNVLNTFRSKLQESKPAPSKWVAYQTTRKVKIARRKNSQNAVFNETSASNPAGNDVLVKKTAVEQPETVTSAPEKIKGTASVTSDEDLIGLVKIAEKTLKGQ